MFELGNTLRDARVRRGLSFEELERVTKIRSKYLRALENEDFEVLPGPTYVKGFLKTYAERLGLDGQLYVDEFNSRYLMGDDDVPFRPRRPARAESRRLTKNAVVLALAAVVVLMLAALFAFMRPTSETAIPNLKPAAGGVASTTAGRGNVRLIVIAAKGSSFVKVESASGELLFAGTLEPSSRQVFHGRKLLLHVSALRNLAFQVGSRVYTTAGARPGPATVTVSARGVDIGPP
jgi:transcriptional regulator with XRE-family HTH domain